MAESITTERERERDEEVASNIHGAMRYVRDKSADAITAQLLNMVQMLQNRLLDHMLEEKETVKELKDGLGRVESKVVAFISAFPNGDAVLHRVAHETQICASKERHQFWSKIKFTLVALLLSGAAVWVGIVLWKAFLIGPKG